MLSNQCLQEYNRRCQQNYNITQLEKFLRHVIKDIRIYKESIKNYVQYPLDRNSYMSALNDIYRYATNYKLAHEARPQKKICHGKQQWFGMEQWLEFQQVPYISYRLQFMSSVWLEVTLHSPYILSLVGLTQLK